MKNLKPKIIYNDKFLDRVGIFFKIGGISLFPIVILREYYLIDIPLWRKRKAKTTNHETIHFQQQLEMLIIPFYILYVLEYLLKFLIYFNVKKAYYNISFEQEAFANDTNLEYLKTRKRFNWIKLIFKKVK